MPSQSHHGPTVGEVSGGNVPGTNGPSIYDRSQVVHDLSPIQPGFEPASFKRNFASMLKATIAVFTTPTTSGHEISALDSRQRKMV
jgi:hypothetical protein